MILDLFKLDGKVAVVTGANTGLGQGMAIALAQAGAKVVLVGRRNCDETQAKIDEFGGQSAQVLADLSLTESVDQILSGALDAFGRVDILVNNAGITKDGLMLRMTDEDFDRVIDVNLKGTFNCTKYVSKYMLKQKSGKIINISSVVGLSGNAGQVNYSASKAGIIGITKSAAKELSSRGITVNAVAPGYVDTDMTKVLSDNIRNEILKNIPLQRMGNVEDISNCVAFLASEDASYITGQVISVDGGMHI